MEHHDEQQKLTAEKQEVGAMMEELCIQSTQQRLQTTEHNEDVTPGKETDLGTQQRQLTGNILSARPAKGTGNSATTAEEGCSSGTESCRSQTKKETKMAVRALDENQIGTFKVDIYDIYGPDYVDDIYRYLRRLEMSDDAS